MVLNSILFMYLTLTIILETTIVKHTTEQFEISHLTYAAQIFTRGDKCENLPNWVNLCRHIV